jgi:hypothetical protein
MVDKTSNAEDRYLESMFRSAEIPDDGFSKRTLFRIRRRIWINRLALPVAVVIGAVFAVEPVTQLVSALFPLLSVLPLEVVDVPMRYLPQLQTIVLGGMTFAAAVALFKVFEET